MRNVEKTAANSNLQGRMWGQIFTLDNEDKMSVWLVRGG